MRNRLLIIAGLLSLLISGSAFAQLEPYKDYDVSKELWNITFIRVHPNMDDDYLEGITAKYRGIFGV